jgi:uncharacterized CHY-type Zn-finger protein
MIEWEAGSVEIMEKKRPIVHGVDVDANTRCAHYHSEKDVIAIKFHCCRQYYACFFCHQELAGHTAEKWPKPQWNEQAILCGNCSNEMTIATYLDAERCPNCDHLFNEGCRNHYHLYFDWEGAN